MNDDLKSVQKQFRYYKLLGEKTFDQLDEEQCLKQFNPESNSIAIIVNHMKGNMLSRWSDFLNSDGEKEWRNRDREFEQVIRSKTELLSAWEEGWNCLFHALEGLKKEDLDGIIYIRNQGHTVTEAIHRQLAHYAYHVGQIVFLGKMMLGSKWNSLSIPKGHSAEFNAEKFGQEKEKRHYTEEFMNLKDSSESERS